jgi:dynein heavy chain
MRAVKSVITAAGNLKRKFPDENESIVMLRAINDVNLAKFLAPDVPLFKNITSDLFPGIVLPEPDYTHMIACMKNQITALNLQAEAYFIEKVIQLYEMIVVRHGLMIVGLPFAGKTSALKVLQGALTELNEKGLMKEMKTHMTVVNPKSITMGQLYGNFDEVSHDWSDGVLAVWYRVLAAQMDKKDRRWLVFDGPVDAIWIENMNTVLDDNKKLCLMSGEIIQMTDNMNMIFEPMDLAVASPATVSRCGMVYMEPHQMGWKPIFNSWKNKLPTCFHEDHIKTITELVEVVIQPLIDFVRNECTETTPTQDQNLVTSCFRIWRGLLAVFDNENFITSIDKKQVHVVIESCFVFSCVWSICCSINTEYRRPFDQQFKKVCSGELESMKVKLQKKILPSSFDRGLIYDYVYFPEKNEWKHWMDLVNKDQLDQFPKNTQVQDIIVTTIDTIRYSYLQEFFIQNEIQSLFVGPTGTGKSAYIQNVLLNKLNREKFITIEVGFSAQTHANQVSHAGLTMLLYRYKTSSTESSISVERTILVPSLACVVSSLSTISTCPRRRTTVPSLLLRS